MGADKHAHSSETDRKGAGTKLTGYFVHYTPYLIAVSEAENNNNNKKQHMFCLPSFGSVIMTLNEGSPKRLQAKHFTR